MPNYIHKVNDLSECATEKKKCFLFFFICIKCMPKAQRQRLLMKTNDRNSTCNIYLVTPELWKAMFCSPPWWETSTGCSSEMQEQKEPKIWNSPWSQSYLRMLRTDRKSVRRDAKHFLRTHKSLFNGFPLARSSLRRWCLHFITNTLKHEQPHEPLRVTPPPASLPLLYSAS